MIETKETEKREEAIVLRSEVEAFECRHLKRAVLARATQTLRIIQPMSLPQVVLAAPQPPNGDVRFVNVTLWPDVPVGGFLCRSERNIEWARSLLPPEVRGVVQSIETTPLFCRSCPFWEQSPEES
jgi:hypothetical protein